MSNTQREENSWYPGSATAEPKVAEVDHKPSLISNPEVTFAAKKPVTVLDPEQPKIDPDASLKALEEKSQGPLSLGTVQEASALYEEAFRPGLADLKKKGLDTATLDRVKTSFHSAAIHAGVPAVEARKMIQIQAQFINKPASDEQSDLWLDETMAALQSEFGAYAGDRIEQYKTYLRENTGFREVVVKTRTANCPEVCLPLIRRLWKTRYRTD